MIFKRTKISENESNMINISTLLIQDCFYPLCFISFILFIFFSGRGLRVHRKKQMSWKHSIVVVWGIVMRKRWVILVCDWESRWWNVEEGESMVVVVAVLLLLVLAMDLLNDFVLSVEIISDVRIWENSRLNKR